MSLCINPRCGQPNHPDNGASITCCACGSELILQGRYRVMRLISSQSGFGRVYEAYERNVPKILKVLKEGYNQNEKVLALFQREAQVLGHLNHPGVPQVGSDGYFVYWPKDRAEPSHCLVMEKIDGPNLKQWMVQQGNHPISEKQAMLWLAQLTDVLHLVHQQNYFHRDIKPENIMLRSSGQLVLVDFGAAREMTQTYMAQLGDSDITAVSSAGYTPPEQEQGQAVPQSDFYAMGRTLIYLLTAKMPSDVAIYDSRLNAFKWRDQAPQISPALADLVDDLIAPAAVDRPQTTGEILDRLALVRAAQITHLPHPDPSKDQPPWPVTTLDPHNALTVAEPSQRGAELARRPWLLAGLLGLAVAVPVAWYGLNRGLGPSGTVGETETAPIETIPVKALKTLAGHSGDIFDMVLLKDGYTVITASADETIRIWNLQTGTTVKTLTGHTNGVLALALTPDQEALVSAGDDRTIRFWAIASGQPIMTLDNTHPLPIRALEISNSGKTLASADSEGNIYLWNLANSDGRINLQNLAGLTPFRKLKADGTINDLRFTRDDSYLASGGKSLHLWNMANLDQPITLEGHAPLTFVNRLEVSADNQTLISASSDKTIQLWSLAPPTPKATLTGHSSYVNDLRIDGPKLWSSDQSKTILIWDLNQQMPVQKISGFVDTDIWKFTVQPDGPIITIGGDQHNVVVWRPETPIVD
ncbi:MAG: protein kinase [Nodosilinea sp.]